MIETLRYLIDNWGTSLFWEEINSGYYQMRDSYLMSQPNFDPYNLSGRDPYYTYVLQRK